MGGGKVMPQALSTNSFKMERHDQVDIISLTKFNELFRSINVSYIAFYYSRIET